MASSRLMGFFVSPFSPPISLKTHRFQIQLHSFNIETKSTLHHNNNHSNNNGVPYSLVADTDIHQNGSFLQPIIIEQDKNFNTSTSSTTTTNDSEEEEEDLAPLWNDGYGVKTVHDFIAEAKEKNKVDNGGSPSWFSPNDCGPPLKNSPNLLFLPGIDGTGLGLTLHHKALGKAFHVRCLHIPVQDRTPFEGLVKLVEEAVKLEHASSPKKPIYLVGDSIGGSLALAVAARNPIIDLVLILVNPATSFDRSQLQPLFPILEVLPDELHAAIPLRSLILGDPVKLASVNIGNNLPPAKRFEQLSYNLNTLLPSLHELENIILPKDTLLWKLKLMKSAASYANARLHSVKAEVLVLASGKDNMFPSADEAQRLVSSLQNCKFRNFKDSGHYLLLEDGVGLLSIIRGTCLYRRSRRRDLVGDFIPPSLREFRYARDEVTGLFRSATGAAMFSTLEDGKIVEGLSGVPDKGPVLFVGYHMLLGIDLIPLVDRFLSEKGVMLHGLAYPDLFTEVGETLSPEFSIIDWGKIHGAVPVTAANMFKLLSKKSHVLLFPGGVREALHFKGEEYKLIWPDQPEFVRMAARFGATIVPFGTVGEDDIVDMLLDYNDLMKIPIVNNYVKEASKNTNKFRDESSGEVANRNIFSPVLLPKIIPGRFYYLFGKPVKTEGMKNMLKDRDAANKLYLQIKSQVKENIDYLLKKREEDPYRNFINRKIYETFNPSETDNTPTFKP
ncbi:hypothetical protein TanjilG_21529 [Lupinus angustifolius]|uniref:Serine aminopeptidase S33 domain-containing protein n=1 Tax=Lupinus angustifolius TaxID=3871 RepID=A0A4P1QUP9_LUPAN|nr:PREDICTED: acyltransferase-like protein At1g54570, chloroplastic [Lupinus angustifolius]OIV95139.1 hypothetical protein TanjilG_21529 [Lupinus angustifolius]